MRRPAHEAWRMASGAADHKDAARRWVGTVGGESAARNVLQQPSSLPGTQRHRVTHRCVPTALPRGHGGPTSARYPQGTPRLHARGARPLSLQAGLHRCGPRRDWLADDMARRHQLVLRNPSGGGSPFFCCQASAPTLTLSGRGKATLFSPSRRSAPRSTSGTGDSAGGALASRGLCGAPPGGAMTSDHKGPDF